MLYQTGENNVPTPSQTIESLPASATEGGGHSGDRRFCGNTFATGRNPETHRLAYVSSHVFDAAEKRGYRVQSHAGTVAAFNSAIHLGCLHPGDHTCQTCCSGSRLVIGIFERNGWSFTIVGIK